eukprot:scaffold1901_cov26-Tisochrysis_lutea.AAC.3
MWCGAACGHLDRIGAVPRGKRVVRAVRRVGHHLLGRRGGAGGEGGRERGALHDPIVITIVGSAPSEQGVHIMPPPPSPD